MLAVWVVGGLLSFFGAVAFAELGAAMPEAGGIYVYLREAYGPLISFLFGWTLFLVIDSGSIATLAVAFSHNILPRFVDMTPARQEAHRGGLRRLPGGRQLRRPPLGVAPPELLTTYIKTAAIGIIVVGVFFFTKGQGNVRNFVDPCPGPFNLGLLGAFGVGLVASLWAYKGWESATYSAGEVKNPQKNLPLGILIGTVAVIVLYVLANLAYLYIMPVGKIAASEGRVALDVMQIVGGPFLASLITFLILFSILGAANQNMLCSPRVYFAMARDGMFFKKIAECHPRFLTPSRRHRRHQPLEHPPDPDRDVQAALHLRHLRRMDLLRPDRRRGHRSAQEEARPAAALQDLGLSGDADHLLSWPPSTSRWDRCSAPSGTPCSGC